MRGKMQWLNRFTPCLMALLLVALGTVPAFAQTATATIRGHVVNEKGQNIPKAEVDAVEVNSGFVHTVTASADGGFVLGGLNPGNYNIVVSATGYQPQTQNATVRIGQNIELDLKLSATAVVTESITVVGNQLVDSKSSEAATNVTPQQMENLPQNDRNFLNFAQLAPGIRLSNDPQRKTIAGDAQPSEQTNVFIDGVSFKNDVLQGGLVGQDSSRGNPFPQNAVQEFRVITQNYSAEYDKASSAIITAVTKSGGNQFSGQAFVFYQPRAWVAPLKSGYQYSTLATNQDYRRYQPGISIGGPIIKDQLNYFFSYEGDDEHATTPVTIGNPAQNGAQFGQYTGVFPSPFKSTLAFGKLSWQPEKNQLVEFSGNYRREHETRDFGGQTSFESATDLRNWVYGGTVRNQWNNDSSLNLLTLALQDYGWNPTPTNPDLVGRNYEGAIRIGGNSTTQDFDQRRLELREEYNFTTFKWNGDHNLQVGGNYDHLNYRVNKSLTGNPQFNYRVDPANNLTFAQPYEAQFGFGNPILTKSNNEMGLYAQDAWTINNHLAVNLGLRWDYESNMLDQDYVTPANIVTALTGKVDPSYFSNGSQRKDDKHEFQPRLGFTYDINGDSRSVIFGGGGRYYDRLFLNATLDEVYRLQYPVYRIEFSPDGAPRGGAPTIMWDPKYMTVAGLHALIASGATSPEIYLLNNNTKTPYSNQYNIGFRQAFGGWTGSVSYNGVRGYHGFTWLSASGTCCQALVPGYGNVIISDPEGKRYKYDAEFLTLDRPYTAQSRWGVHVAWTHAKATQTGNDLFSLDMPTAAQYGFHDVPGSERDRINVSGIFGLPWDLRFSTILSFGSGAAATVLDFRNGYDLQNRLDTHPFAFSVYPKKTDGFADRDVDFRLEKDFRVSGMASIGVVAEVFNAFNFANYGCLDTGLGPGGNTNLGNPGCVINLGRREQVGLKVNF